MDKENPSMDYSKATKPIVYMLITWNRVEVMPLITKLSTSFLLLFLLLAISNGNGAVPPKEISDGLQKVIANSTESSRMPGLVIQVVAPNWTWTSAAGNANLDPQVLAEPDMRFRIASVSKTFTATAILKLAEEEKLGLNDSIDRWLPQKYLDKIQDHSNITISMLLQHRSGLADYDEEGLIPLQISKPDTPVTTDTAIFQGLDKGLLYKPGTNYTYSNVGYLLLAKIVDNASGMSYEDYIRKIIIDPLGLRDTIMPTSPAINIIPGKHMSCLYAENNSSAPENYTTMYILWDRGAGDIISTVEDLNAFHKALRDGKIIDDKMLREMQNFKPIIPGKTDRGYGMAYGFSKVSLGSKNATLMGHLGGYPGAITIFYYWLEKDTYISFNMNGLDPSASSAVFKGILSCLADQST